MFINSKKVIGNFLVAFALLLIYISLSYHYGRYTKLSSVNEILTHQIEEEISFVNESIINSPQFNTGQVKKLSGQEPYRDFVYVKNDSVYFYTTNEIVWENSCLNKQKLCLEETANRILLINPVKLSANEKILHLISIRKKYDISNRFLQNNFLIDNNIPQEIKIHPDKGEKVVKWQGRELFYLHADDELSPGKHQVNRLFIVFLAFLLSAFILIKTLYDQISYFKERRGLKLIGMIFDILILLFVLIYFQIPGKLFDSYLFGGSLFVFPGVFRNLGQAVFILTGVAIISWGIFKTYFDTDWKGQTSKTINGIILMALAVFILFFPYMLIKNLVLNSSIPLSINSLDEIDFTSVLAIITIFSGGLSALLLHLKFIRMAYSLFTKRTLYIISSAIGALTLAYLSLVQNPLYLLLLFQFLVISLSIYYFKARINLTFAAIVLITSSISYSFILEQLNDEKENQQIELRALSLLNNRDRISEYRFYEGADKMSSDPKLDSLVEAYEKNALVENKLIGYLENNYFTTFHLKYELNFTICDSRTKLIIDDEKNPVDCYSYFDELITQYGIKTVSKDLFYIDDGDEIRNYIGKIRLEKNLILYMDIYQKSSPLAQGYPELLESRYSEKMLDPEYSYAMYYKDELINSYGDVDYPITYQKGISIVSQKFIHFEFSDETGKVLVISKKRDTYTEYLASATDFILIFGLLLLVFHFINEQKINFSYLVKFRSRLQLSIFSILLFSFIIIGFFVFSHISKQNEEKNRNNLEELSHSIRIELEHKFAHLDDIDDISQSYIYDQLVKFSQVFFSDINLFNTSGELITSSRPRVFERNIISRKINPDPYYKLREKNLTIYIYKENIGDYKFLSSYFPLRNYDNEVIAYVNLPYFSKQRQLTEEISSFLTTFINIYIILTIASLFIIWVISNYITKPMETIKDFLRKTELQGKNAKIDIHRKDEIGELVKEYNSMVEELEKSARLLAASERETAWREMARQVAHEIKNPLTPMKLSVQQFERSFLQNPEKSEETVKRFTWNIIQQIDSLSEIASAFSDFAKMPKASMRKINLADTIKNTTELFEGEEHVEITSYFDSADLYIEADQKQIQRVFINLIKNSIQALGSRKGARIYIRGYKEAGNAVITIRDNGPGIPGDKKDKIFLPNFTTKSGGTGLGLAMVKNIVTGFRGDVSLVRSDEDGTEFRLIFPIWTGSES